MLTVLCGGVGGAKLVDGIAAVLADPSALTVIVNTADDWQHLGLHISPDVDRVLYTLAGLAGRERGWGIEGDTWATLEMLGRYGIPTWFRLGDRDLATHIARTVWLREGRRLTEVTHRLREALRIAPVVLPMSDDRVATVVRTPAGRLPFQEYFVLRGARDPVTAVEFEGLDRARPSPEAVEAVRSARLLIVAPSNPVVSIRPILALPGMEAALAQSAALRVAVTPLIRGEAVKGPTVEMLRGLGMDAAPHAVAALYRAFLDVFVLDARDRPLAGSVAGAGSPGRALEVECADTLMPDAAGRRRLARDLLAIARARGVEIPVRPE
ncbi:MAG: 2-phospho-L-lactate transferase [Bacillati bacterium ANGP1]|uniref:2-phospho-L-lactate transferase n=1 Tax=Candidatus Segetimicrobium genomatis TaxID=2569760 RepID=A0A537M1L4_9BACT|nr:MAG: 2-phospho-L-lactate transferase [Terrabacteria group bacterium ANGP1]